MTCIIFGGAGYLGRFVIDILLKKTDWNIIVITRNPAKTMFFSNERIQFKSEIDITFKDFIIINLAFDLGISYKETYNKNQQLFNSIKKFAEHKNCKKIIHISSIAVYGKIPSIIYPFPLKKVKRDDTYCYTKSLMELRLQKFADEINKPLIIIRSGNIMGPGSVWAAKLAQRLYDGLPILGKEKEHPSNVTYVENLAYIIFRYSQEFKTNNIHIVNCAEFGNISWNKWAKEFNNILGKKIKCWPVDDINIYKPKWREDLNQVRRSIVKAALPALAKGRASSKLVFLISNFADASNLKNRSKKLVKKSDTSMLEYIDASEYNMASIYLAKKTFGTENVKEEYINNIQIDFDTSIKRLKNWLHFSMYVKI